LLIQWFKGYIYFLVLALVLDGHRNMGCGVLVSTE